MLQTLGMLERFDMAKLGKDSPVAWHLIGEAMQLAYADRDKWAGDHRASSKCPSPDCSTRLYREQPQCD